MEAVGDFALEDKIFPEIPGDSLLFDGTELTRRKTRPSARTLTAPLPRNHMVVEAGSMAQARMVPHIL